MTQIFFNHATGGLSRGRDADASETEIEVEAWTGFPLSLTQGDYFLASLHKGDDPLGGVFEVVKVTAVTENSGDLTFVAERGIEGPLQSFATGDKITAVVSAGTYASFVTEEDLGGLADAIDEILGVP